MLRRISLAVLVLLFAMAAITFFKPTHIAHAASSCSGSGSSEVCTVTGTISWYGTDWGNNQVMVSINSAVENPGNCAFPGQYETLPASETTENAALLGAVLHNLGVPQTDSVVVTLQIGTTCTGTASRAGILGVQITPP